MDGRQVGLVGKGSRQKIEAAGQDLRGVSFGEGRREAAGVARAAAAVGRRLLDGV